MVVGQTFGQSVGEVKTVNLRLHNSCVYPITGRRFSGSSNVPYYFCSSLNGIFVLAFSFNHNHHLCHIGERNKGFRSEGCILGRDDF